MVELKNSNEIRTYSCPNCYLCNSPGKFIYQKLIDRLFDASGEWNFRKCSNSECGLVWLDPMPLLEDIAKAYNTYYTHEIEYTQQNFVGRLLKAIYHKVKIIPAYIFGLKAQELQLESMYLKNVKPGSLLDVGCGSGKFLHQMYLAGWKVKGIDFDPKVVKQVCAKYDFDVRCGSLESMGYQNNSFDAVTMSHVIEHVHDPIALLQECYRILKSTGYLVVTTPNINSWGHQKFKNNWRGLEPPRHLHIFSINTLEQCAKKAGFQHIEVCSTAAHAIAFMHGSLGIQKWSYYKGSTEPNKWDFIKSLFMYYYENLLIKKYPELGEETILICKK